MCIDIATQVDPFYISCVSFSPVDAPRFSLPILALLLDVGKYTSKYWHGLKVSQHGSRCSLTIILAGCPSALSTRAFKKVVVPLCQELTDLADSFLCLNSPFTVAQSFSCFYRPYWIQYSSFFIPVFLKKTFVIRKLQVF